MKDKERILTRARGMMTLTLAPRLLLVCTHYTLYLTRVLCILLGCFVFWQAALYSGRMLCILPGCFVFWQGDLYFGRVLCILAGCFVFCQDPLYSGRVLCILVGCVFLPFSTPSPSVINRNQCSNPHPLLPNTMQSGNHRLEPPPQTRFLNTFIYHAPYCG